MSVRPGLWNMLSKPPEVRGGSMSVFPGRVERVDGVSGKGWPALAGSLPFPHHLKDGRGIERGGQDGRTSRRSPAAGRSAARCGDVVSIASPRIGRGGRPSLSLSADTSGRSGERLAMVWTVKASDGAEREARNWRRCRRNPSPWFSLFLPFCLFLFFLYI